MARTSVEASRTGDQETAALRRLDGLAYVLDNSIPLPGIGRVGLDAVIGLVPGVGDAAGALLSAYIVVEAARAGAPAPVLTRMVMNVAVEGVIGAIPFIGDVFDAAWKANDRNVRLLRRAVEAPGATRRSSTAMIAAVLVALAVVLVGIGVLAFLALRAFWGAVF